MLTAFQIPLVLSHLAVSDTDEAIIHQNISFSQEMFEANLNSAFIDC